MGSSILLGLGRLLFPIPRRLWRTLVHRETGQAADRLAFMSSDHHRVRDFCVLELARGGVPLEPEAISASLDLDPDRVTTILDELERNMTFVYRSQGDAVTWAYPVTVDRTPHHVVFSTGESAYAA